MKHLAYRLYIVSIWAFVEILGGFGDVCIYILWLVESDDIAYTACKTLDSD